MFRVNNFSTIQECIPLGCVPAAAVATTRCQYKRDFCPEGVSVQGVSVHRDLFPEGVSIGGLCLSPTSRTD